MLPTARALPSRYSARRLQPSANTVPRFLRQVFLPRPPIEFRPALRYAFVIMGWDIFVDEVDPPPDRRLAETQHQNRVWVGCLPVSSAPRLDNDLVRYDQQIASAELASPSRELAPGLAAHPRRTARCL